MGDAVGERSGGTGGPTHDVHTAKDSLQPSRMRHWRAAAIAIAVVLIAGAISAVASAAFVSTNETARDVKAITL